jgi:DNA-binding HxlR family transcriptional regulator
VETIKRTHLIEEEGDPFVRECPSRAVLDLLANKWTTLVLCALSDGELRFGQLRRRVAGVTQKMLTQTLRALERDGLVTRTVYPTTPPSVGYALTDLGRSAADLHDAIIAWAQEHAAEILAAREEHDERANRKPSPVS